VLSTRRLPASGAGKGGSIANMASEMPSASSEPREATSGSPAARPYSDAARPPAVSVGLGPTTQADRSTLVGSAAYVLQGFLTALAPARMLVALALVLLCTVGGWLFDHAYLAAGGAPFVVPTASATPRRDNPLQEAERYARTSAATMVGGTAFASQVTTTSTLAELRAAVDAAGREKLSRVEDDARRRSAILLEWDRATAAIDRARPRGPAEHVAADFSGSVRRLVAGVVGLSISEIGSALLDGAYRTPVDVVASGGATWLGLLGSCLWLLILLLAFALGGGALARMSAVEIARGEKITTLAAWAWLRSAWIRLIGVPLAPIVLVCALVLVVAVIGLLLRWPVLDLIGGLLYVVALGAMTLAIGISVAAVLGLPMSLAAVACGDADALDAGVRCTAHLFRHPLRSATLIVASLLSIGVGTLLVGTLIWLALGLTSALVGWLGGDGAAMASGAPSLLGVGGIGREGQDFGVIAGRLAGFSERPAAAAVDLWEALFAMTVMAYVISALVEAFTRSYIALRLACDGEDCSALDGVTLGRPAAPPSSLTHPTSA
jgi:hypothetical protein